MEKQWKQCQTLFIYLFIFDSKITADGDCIHEIKRRLLLGRKVKTNLAYWKAEILLCQQSPSSQGYGFSSGHLWMWELDCEESWAPKTWYFWTVMLEKTLESPLDGKIQPVHPKGDQSWCSLEGLILKLKFQYFGHLMWRVDSLEKTLMLGGIGDRRRRGWQRMRWLDGITDSMDMSLNELWELVIDRRPVLWFMGLQRVGHNWATELNWITNYFESLLK